MAGWLQGFQRDLHPEQEICLWTAAARAFEAFASTQKLLNRSTSKEVFHVLLASMNNEVNRFQDKLRRLSLKDALEIERLYQQALSEVSVEMGGLLR